MCGIKAKTVQKGKKEKSYAKIPYIWKSMFKLDNQGYKISDKHIRIPIRKREYCAIKLATYVLEQLKHAKLGSITITENKLIISYSKEIDMLKPSDFVAIDRNLDNVTAFDTENNLTVHNLHKATKIKARYSQIKSKFRRNDLRIRKKIFQKYGTKEKNKVHQILHAVSKKIVSSNKGIILEDINPKNTE